MPAGAAARSPCLTHRRDEHLCNLPLPLLLASADINHASEGLQQNDVNNSRYSFSILYSLQKEALSGSEIICISKSRVNLLEKGDVLAIDTQTGHPVNTHNSRSTSCV